MKVLIADDDRVLTLLLTRRLQALGWRVDVAMDAMQALMFANRGMPDVISLDISMPGGSGVDTLMKLKRLAKTGHIPVLVLSGSIDQDIERSVLALGADAFLKKPVDPEKLHSALVQLAGDSASSLTR